MADTTPYVGTHKMLSGESHLMAANLAGSLAVGETLSAPVSELTDRTNGRAVALGEAPSILTTSIRQRIGGLIPGHSYNLILRALGSSGNTWGAWYIILVVP